MSDKPILHGADHLPGHADPIPGLGSSGLPPWFEWTPAVNFPNVTLGTPGTQPDVDVEFAWLLVQTDDGVALPDGGATVQHGTLAGEYVVSFNDPGEMGSGSQGVPVFKCDLVVGVLDPLNPSGFTFAPNGAGVAGLGGLTHLGQLIGSGIVEQASTKTLYHVEVNADGFLVVPNVPDTADFSGAIIETTTRKNFCRVGNPFVTPAIPGFPWEWAEGDRISIHYVATYKVSE